MAYELTAPDGRKFRVTPPPGTPPEAVTSLVQQMTGTPAAPSPVTGGTVTGGGAVVAPGVGGMPGRVPRIPEAQAPPPPPSGAPGSVGGALAGALPSADTEPIPKSTFDTTALQLGKEAVQAAVPLAAPMLTPEIVGAPLFYKALRAIANTVASTAVNLGIEKGYRTLTGRAQPDANETGIIFAANALPEIVGTTVREIGLHAAERQALDEALGTVGQARKKVAQTAATAAERGAVAQTRAAEAEARRGETQGLLARSETLDYGQGAAAKQVEEAQGAVRGIPQTFGPPESPHGVGRNLQVEMTRGQALAEKQRRRLYGEETTLGDNLTQPRPDPGLVQRMRDFLQSLAAKEDVGLPQSPRVRRHVNALLTASTEEAPEKPLLYSAAGEPITSPVVAPEPRKLRYSDYDAMRQYIQPYTRAYSQPGVRRTWDQGVANSLYGDIKKAMARMRAGHGPLEEAAKNAEDFYVNEVIPVRDVAGMVRANPQPTAIMRTLLLPGNEDRLITALKTGSPELGAKLRYAAFEDTFRRRAMEGGQFAPEKALTWWDGLTPRQQGALAGGRREQVREVFEALRQGLQNKRSLDVERQALMQQLERSFPRLAEADRQAETALAQQTAALTEHREAGRALEDRLVQQQTKRREATLVTVLPGVTAAVYHLTNGDPQKAALDLAGSFVGRQILAGLLTSERGTAFLAKAVTVPRGSRLAAKYGVALLGQMGADALNVRMPDPGEQAATDATAGHPWTQPAPQIPGRQEGGAVAAGMPYVVGEAGPEIMVPAESGMVVPTVQQAGPWADQYVTQEMAAASAPAEAGPWAGQYGAPAASETVAVPQYAAAPQKTVGEPKKSPQGQSSRSSARVATVAPIAASAIPEVPVPPPNNALAQLVAALLAQGRPQFGRRQ